MSNSRALITELISQGALKEIETLVEWLDLSESEMKRLIGTVNNLNAALQSGKGLKESVKLQKQLAEAMEAVVKAGNQYNGNMERLNALINANNNAGTQRNRITRDEARAMGELARAALDNARAEDVRQRNTARAMRADVGATDSLKAKARQLVELREQYRRLSAAERENEQVGGALLRQIRALDTELRRQDQTVSRTTSNFRGMAAGLSNIRGIVTGLVATLATKFGIEQLFGTARQIESTDTALKNVSRTQQELTVNEIFLAEETDRLGLEILETTKAFKGFYAASTLAGISTKDTRDIFDAAAGASAALKLSQDQTNGVLLAFSQIASKGKVQAEELRGQIGERLPGAFSIAAKAIGVSEMELDKMMKKGEVIARDFLPKFAAELKRTFGGDSQEYIKGLEASVNRLENQFTALVKGNNAITKLFQSIIDGAKVVLSVFNDLSDTTLDLAVNTGKEAREAQGLVNEYEALTAKGKLTNNEKHRLNEITGLLTASLGSSVVEWNKETGAMELNLQKTKELIAQKLLLANDEAAKQAAIYRRVKEQETQLLDQRKKIEQSIAPLLSDKTLAQIRRQELVLREGIKFGEFADPLTKNEKAAFALGETLKPIDAKLKEYQETIKDTGKALEALGFSIQDVENLLNPPAPPTPPVTGGTDTGTGKSKRDWTNETLAAKKKGYELDAKAFISTKEAEATKIKAIAEDETKSIELRTAAWYEYYALQKDMAAAKNSAEIAGLTDTMAAITRIERKAVKDRTDEEKGLLLQKDNTLKQLIAYAAEYNGKLVELDANLNKELRSIADKQIKEVQKTRAEELRDLNASVVEGIKSFEVWYQEATDAKVEKTGAAGHKLLKIQRDFTKQAFNDFLAYIEEMRKVEGVSQDTINKLLAQGHRLKRKYFKADIELTKDTVREINDYIEAGKGIATALSGDTKDISSQLDFIDRMKEARIAAIEAEATSEEDKNKRIALAEMQAQLKRDEIEKRQKAAEQRRANILKLASAFQAALNTAVAVTEFLKKGDITGAITAGIMGAASIITIASTAVPKYKDGTPTNAGHPGGPMIVGDGGKSEMIIDNGKIYKSPDKPTLMYGSPGTIVKPDFDKEVQKHAEQLEAVGLSASTVPMAHGLDAQQVSNELARLRRQTVKNTEVLQAIAKNTKTKQQPGDAWQEYKSKKHGR